MLNVNRVDTGKNEVNSFIQETISILSTSAEQTLGTTVGAKYADRKYTGQTNKLWFNEPCKKWKRTFANKRLCKKHGSNIFKNRLKLAEEHYKNTMDENII